MKITGYESEFTVRIWARDTPAKLRGNAKLVRIVIVLMKVL